MDEKATANLLSLTECVEHFTRAFVNADTFREQIHLAAHILDHLHMIETEVESAIKGQPRPAIEVEKSPQRSFPEFEGDSPCQERAQSPSGENGPKQNGHEKHPDGHSPTFRNLTLVQAGEILLTEHPVLHGKELERLMKERGYRSKAEHFQKMLQATFTRDGRFENTGLNHWRLKQVVSNGQNGDGSVKAGEERPETLS